LALARLRHRPRASRGGRAEPSALALAPLLEARRLIGKEALQEVTAIEIERLGVAAGIDGITKRGRVTPQGSGVDAEILRAATDEDRFG
jgi:hypothetical protein